MRIPGIPGLVPDRGFFFFYPSPHAWQFSDCRQKLSPGLYHLKPKAVARKILIFLLLLIAAITTTQAQFLSGTITDDATQHPIPYAHIAIPETGEGTVSDERGHYTLHLIPGTSTRHVKISLIGYRPIQLPVPFHGGIIDVALHPDTILLQAVEITPIDPRQLIQQALARLPQNHGGKRTLTCFYRLAARKSDQHIHISEAAFDLHQSPDQEAQLNIAKAREVEDVRAFNGVGMAIGTKVSTMKKIDLAANATTLFLSKSGLRKHDFTYEGVVHLGTEEVHEISFDQKPFIKEGLYRGKIFFSTSSLALVHVEYELSPRGLPYIQAGSAAERAALKLLNIQLDVRRQRTAISYRPFGSRWYLDYIIRDETTRVASRRYGFDVIVDERSEFLVTRIDTTRSFTAAGSTAGRFLESSADTSHTFWKGYNIMPSSLNYDTLAANIEVRNGYTALKTSVRAVLQRAPKVPAARVDSILRIYHQKGMFEGVALIQHRGRVILHRGYGYADRTVNRLHDTTTVFRIGSLSKTFTSRIIFTLQQAGLLQYRDTVQKFLPWYPHRGITIEHLLTHVSGLLSYTDHPDFIDSIQHVYSLEEVIRHFGCEPPLFAAGTDFSYSNTGYTLLALIAESVSAKSFQQLLQEIISGPLELKHTSLNGQELGLAKGYLYGAEEPAYAVSNVMGAGAMTSTAADLLRWANNQSTPGLDAQFVPRRYYRDWGVDYGYGWMIDRYQFRVSKQHTVILHPGTDFGFKTMLAHQLDRDNTVILLNNTGEFPLFDMTDLILSELN
jgi:CubicO group peptidase (beta-lactamase class C family)